MCDKVIYHVIISNKYKMFFNVLIFIYSLWVALVLFISVASLIITSSILSFNDEDKKLWFYLLYMVLLHVWVVIFYVHANASTIPIICYIEHGVVMICSNIMGIYILINMSDSDRETYEKDYFPLYISVYVVIITEGVFIIYHFLKFTKRAYHKVCHNQSSSESEFLL